MDLKRNRSATRLSDRIDRTRERTRRRGISLAQTDDVGWIPPIQLKPTGDPISVTDGVVNAVVISVVLGGIGKIVGPF